MKKATDGLSIGAVAARTGLSISAIRFYEEKGLVSSDRNRGGQRRFVRADIRRLSFVQIAQQLGFSIAQIREVLSGLPEGRTPTKDDWSRISVAFREDIERRISRLERLRDRIDDCIGCGCLSLENCALYNPQDRAGVTGSGARFVLDAPSASDESGAPQ